MQLFPVSVAAALAAYGSLPPALAQTQLQPAPPEAAASAPARQQRPTQRPAAKPADAKPPAQLDRVEVDGQASDESIRRASTASKIVITREEIDRFGDTTLGEVIKRLPGVTTGGRPGRGGEIRMRGMGRGYTQILVNGERMPPGFSLDELPPEQIERIEVLRAPTAEYGTRAVAGTINIVLREALKRKLNEFRAGFAAERGRLSPGLSWTRNDGFGAGHAYNFTVNAMRGERLDKVINDTLTHTDASGSDSLLSSRGTSADSRTGLHVNARIQLKLDGGDSLALQPFLVSSRSDTSSHLLQTTTPAPSPQPAGFFDQFDTGGSSRFTMARLNAQWLTRAGPDTRIELRGGIGHAQGDSHSRRQERLAGVATRLQDDDTQSRDSSWSALAKLSHNLGGEHSLVAGLEGEGTTRDQNRVTLVNGAPQPGLQDFGDDLDAASTRFAAYAQDEWSMGKQWDFYAGARWEGITTRSSAANYDAHNRSSVFTPLAHARYKLDERGRQMLRFSLTRSYRSPQLQDLIARPTLNSQVPHQANTPDRAGNPDLKPELATGFEIGFENYLSKGGLLSANFFARRISNLMRTVTSLETVSWSATPRWVARPRNIGNASTAGLELEARFRLDEWLEDALPVNVRSNLSLFTSRVGGIPGPNNRIDAQPKGTANLGADYRLKTLPLSLGASLNWTPQTTIQQTTLTEVTASRKAVLDAFALWAIDTAQSLRLSATNLSALDYFTGTVIDTGAQLITSRSGGPSYTQWQLRWEMKI
ncbi:TonB-dependent receptor plug domain-containing protein [Roseateles saccharophilus]|uniref:Iron complex outermembrane receptor protein n=1 Tax=Roseateles saccharophilus TaxID=304 RepID=A0A4R3UCM4_ROSSA|nr:TonB-dependent receptor [Roseateles saccharophilus]MDG0835571.1 TonB-dependent receptor [Roseateles saccharophilus]TCU85485.1 iron complex outermembrane receptor protein [Roseateles saccharophilus]